MAHALNGQLRTLVPSSACDVICERKTTNVRGKPRAVAVGFEPTNGLPRYTLSSSANPRSAMVVDVRFVLNEPVRGSHRTQPDDNE